MKSFAIATLLACAACTPSPPPQPTTASSGASAPSTTLAAPPQAATALANMDQPPFIRGDAGLSARTWTEAERAKREAAASDLLRKMPNNAPRAPQPESTNPLSRGLQ